MNMHCPSCNKDVEAVQGSCSECGYQYRADALNARPPVIARPAPRPKIPVCLEMGVTVDRTESSKAFEVGIPLTAEKILSQVNAKAAVVKCWVQSHGDLEEKQEMVLLTDGDTPDQAIKDIRSITYIGGGDPPEHHLDAIEQLLNTIPWTNDPKTSRSAILAFTTADTKPARSGMSPRELGEEIRSRGILLYLVSEPTPALEDLVDAAGGLLFQISNNPDLASLQQIAGRLAQSITSTLSSGSTVPMTV